MTTRKNFGGGVTDATLLPTNTVGGVLNVIPNTLQGVRNSGNTAANVIKNMSSRIADAFTHKPFNYEKLDKFIAGDSFMKKRKTTFGNAWKGIKNTPRFFGNVIKQLGGGALATAIYGTAMVVGAPVGAAATLVKNTTQSVAGGVVDPMNSILKIGQQGPDDKGLAFTNVQKVNTISYTDYAKRITDNRARKKAKRKEKRDAIKAINAKYDGTSLVPNAPTPVPAPQAPSAPDTETSDGAKKNKDVGTPTTTSTSPIIVSPTTPDGGVVVLGPMDDSEVKTQPHKISFATKIDEISTQGNHLAPIASIFSVKKDMLGDVKHKVVDKIDTSKTANPGVNAVGMVSLKIEKNKIFPHMFIKTTSKDDAEIVLHELIHYYINPYLEAAIKQKNGDIKINTAQENSALTLYDSLHSLYTEAKNKNYNVINGTSIEECMEEFVATITNAESVTKLKELGLYDQLFHIIRTHIESINSDTVNFTPVQNAA